MKKWEESCVAGIFSVILGVILFAWGVSTHIPSAYKTFLGIPYSVNPEFASAFAWMLLLMMMGVLFFGLGLGFLGCVYTTYTLEKKAERLPPPPPR